MVILDLSLQILTQFVVKELIEASQMLVNKTNLWNDGDSGPEPAQSQLRDVNTVNGYGATCCLNDSRFWQIVRSISDQKQNKKKHSILPLIMKVNFLIYQASKNRIKET
jgi:hypothetical protein